jgi:four helix bundle protein
LKVWQKARWFAGQIYQVTEAFQPKEQYGLTSQTRRASVSIISNLAEGSGRGSDRVLLRFVRIALGSSREVESHLILAQDLHFAEQERLRSLRREAEEIRSMLAGLAKRLEEDS